MVKRIFSILNKEFNNINQAALLLGFFTLLSQILALLRDRSFAHFIGPGETLDVYYAAFRIPDFLYISLASLASVTVLIPFLIDKMKKDGDGINHTKKFLNDVFTIFLGAMALISLILFFLMPKIIPFITPGFSVILQAKVVAVSRIMLLSPILLGISNMFGSVTQLYKKFFVYSLSPVFYNIGIITGIIFLYPLFGVKGLAIGVVLGAALHFLIQLPILISHKFTPHFSFKINFKEIKQVINLSLPRTLGLAMNSISLIAIISLASFMKAGSISLFSFSFNLQSVPLNIVGLSYSVAAFPTLAQFFSADDKKNFLLHIRTAARQITFWTLPVVFLFIVLRAQIVRVILGSGRFSWSDTKLTAAGLAIFSVSILSQSLVMLLVRGYYASGNTKRPLLINVVSSIATIILAFGLIKLFTHWHGFRYFIEALLRIDGLPGSEILMLPLAYSLGTIVNSLILYRFFKKEFVKQNEDGRDFIQKTFFQSFAGAFFMGFVAYQFLVFFGGVFNLNTFLGIFLQGFLSGILGIVAGVAVLKLLGSEELDDVYRTLRSKFWKAKVITSGSGEL